MSNEGKLDRGFRIVLGLLILSLMFFGPHAWWGAFGIVPLLTGLTGWCPLYHVFGIDTCHRASA